MFFLKKNKFYIGGAFLIILLTILFTAGFSTNDKVIASEIKEEVKEQVLETFKVDIKGAVVSPGVYEVNANARVIDAINEAGGLNENADTSVTNLAEKITDEMVITVYTKDEVLKCQETKNETSVNQTSTEVTTNPKLSPEICNICPSSLKEDNSKININKASLEELQTLSGIGLSKAEAIISYRTENGLFKSLEDIMNVSGIGESAYAKIKDYITY